MNVITKKHILIVEVEILQGGPDHLQTQMKVLNEMSYEKYKKMIESVNLIQKIKNFFEEK